jgi:hypothetical protein
MGIEQQIQDMKSCSTFLKQSDFKITIHEMNSLDLQDLSASCRSCIYAAVSFARGKVGKTLAFLQFAKDHAKDLDEMAYLFHLEGVLFFMMGDAKTAIRRQHECIDLSELSNNGRLKADALSRLAFIFESVGENDVAKKYEKQAARLLMRRDLQ